MAVGGFVAALAALLLGAAWMLMHDRALAWWASASAVQSAGIAFLVYGLISVNLVGIAVGAAVNALNPVLVWAGTRVFFGRRVPVIGLLAGSAVILAANAFPVAEGIDTSARITGFIVSIGYLLAAIWELWRDRKEPLRARWAVMAFLTVHSVVFLGGIVDTLMGNMGALGIPLLFNSWFGLIHFESLIYSMGTAVFMVVMCKERSEHGFREAAHEDALTGLANRRAFMAQANQMLARCRKDNAPATIIVFDLDRFKAINDTHGHTAGDQVLRAFADSARKCLRPKNDLLGRHGGEEFALLLPGATIETGMAIAERIRIAFAEASDAIDHRISATLSAGVAAADPASTIGELLETADSALYRAKNLGRNRVERSSEAGTGKDTPDIIRVA